jgi:hypothetical protein
MDPAWQRSFRMVNFVRSLFIGVCNSFFAYIRFAESSDVPSGAYLITVTATGNTATASEKLTAMVPKSSKIVY